MIPLLRAFSFYSFGRGVLSPEALCRTAAARGVTHVAMVDVGGFYGFVEFLRAARQYGITPIAGMTLLLPEGPLTFLAETREGYTSLARLTTAHHARPRSAAELLAGSVEPCHIVTLGSTASALAAAVAWAGPARVCAALDVGPRAVAAAQYAETYGLRSVMAPQIYLADPEGAQVHRLQRAVALQTSLDRIPTTELWPVPGIVPSARDAEAWRTAWPDAWAQTVELAERCAVTWEFTRPILPRIHDSPVDAVHHLRSLAEAGARRRYSDPAPPEVAPRLEGELKVIAERGLADYFLLVHEIVEIAEAYATCGRGSGASSLVSYCLGITDVDPLAADLYFERFLGPGRADIPDLDLDFPWDERPQALRRVFESRPPGEVALVANHVTFRGRAAVREAGRVLGIPEKQLTELSGHIGRRGEDLVVKEGRHAIEGLRRPRTDRVLQAAAMLRGLPRHLSRHAGGVVIVPGGVDTVVPYEPLPDGLGVIQWEKDQAEDAGLVKIDLLGNRSLSVVRDAIRHVNTGKGETLAYETLSPLHDPDTQSLLARGDTMGIFYVESPAMRQLQAKAATGAFESLVVHSSLIRPAANRWIAEYVRRLRGGTHQAIHPFLDHLLTDSRGVLCYQEDVMRVAVELAGFDHHLADQLRRTLSGKRGIPLAELSVRFKEGLRVRGFGEDHVATLWSMVESFAGYSFCKAHSASYALLSFKSAYLKAHHPAEFMAAVLSNGGGYYSAQAYVSELRRMGLNLHGPDVNASEVEFTPDDGGVRVGLAQIRALGDERAREMVECRADGSFVSLEDLLCRCPLPVQAVQGLILSGALDTLHGPGCRIPLLHQLAEWSAVARRRDLMLIPPPAIQYARPMDEHLARMQELETLGFTVAGHPLDLVTTPEDVIPARDIPQFVGKTVRLLGWYVTSKPVQTKHGEDMAFVAFEDRESLFETVVFPQQYHGARQELESNRGYVVEGRVTEEWGVCTVEVERLKALPSIAYRLTSQYSTAVPLRSARSRCR